MKKLLYYFIFWSIFLLPVLVFMGCRKENAVDSGKSSHYYYSEDNSKVLYDAKTGVLSFVTEDYKDVTNDVANFSVISQHYGKDSKHIYYTYKPLTNVDYTSFGWNEELGLPKDKRHIYLSSTDTDALTVIKDADPDTYKKVKLDISCANNWYRDKNHYFYNHEKTAADRATLSFEVAYLPYDKRYVFWVEAEKVNKKEYTGTIKVVSPYMLKDDKSYYFKQDCDSAYRCIDYDDSQSVFGFYDKSFLRFRIGSCVFISGVKFLEGIVDADSFQLLRYSYSKDKNHIYYEDKIIKDADPETFEIIDYFYAKDKHRVYKFEKELRGYKPNEFVTDKWGRYPDDSSYGKEPPRVSRRSWRDDD